MSKYKLKDSSGQYYVAGKGFVAAAKKDGSSVTDDNVKCLTDLGYSFTSETASGLCGAKSYAVVYIRSKDVNGIMLDKKNPDANLGEVDPSKRRFATFAEAKQHGNRFNVRKANAGDKPGTANHVGFYVVGTEDEVNSKVNWATGLTNSIKE